jgi:glyoxylase-like metal-dependent hydrolase (beta-lactamase superfamily II)
LKLPKNICVIERGWLNCNQVLLLDPRGPTHDDASNILIDSGYSTHAQTTLDLLAAPENLGTARLSRIINTHCHSDHMGGNAAVHRKYGCGITIPAGEARHLRPWDAQAIWMGYADQYAEPFEFDTVMHADESFQGGGDAWQALAAPGHDMDALMFWCAAERVLITGDALWQKGLGFVQPQAVADGANLNIDAALEAILIIEDCAPAIIIPGHGAPFSGDEITAAIAFARARLSAFALDPAKNARHVMKVMFVFALLHKNALPVAALEQYLSKVPCYQDLNQFLGLSIPQLADWLLADLLKAGAVKVVDGDIIPTARA